MLTISGRSTDNELKISIIHSDSKDPEDTNIIALSIVLSHDKNAEEFVFLSSEEVAALVAYLIKATKIKGT